LHIEVFIKKNKPSATQMCNFATLMQTNNYPPVEQIPPGKIKSLLTGKCPRCRIGELYESKQVYNLNKTVRMHQYCSTCQQPTDIEVGFYYGTGYLSYFITIILLAIYFILWYLIIGFNVSDNRIWYCLASGTGLIILAQPLLMRFSRTLWLYFFVNYNANWPNERPDNYERIVKEQMGNW
jgi:uncharacterized protein (DUF983 family)